MRISDWSSDVCSSDLLVGIGGGIFLAPLLHLTRWRDARAIAATASLFILINSMFGLAGQMLKNWPEVFGPAIGGGLPLLVAVAVGGQLGRLVAVRFLPHRMTTFVTCTRGIWGGDKA